MRFFCSFVRSRSGKKFLRYVNSRQRNIRFTYEKKNRIVSLRSWISRSSPSLLIVSRLLCTARKYSLDVSAELWTPLSHRPRQIHPKKIPKQKRCRNRRPQANKTLKTTSPSTPLEKFIPKQKSIKSPSKRRKSYVPRHWLITPKANPKQTPRIRSDPVVKGAG